MVYYFVAYYGPDKAYTYDINNNSWLPYSPIYRRRYRDYFQALQARKRAIKKNPDKREYIFIDSAISYTMEGNNA